MHKVRCHNGLWKLLGRFASPAVTLSQGNAKGGGTRISRVAREESLQPASADFSGRGFRAVRCRTTLVMLSPLLAASP